MVCVTELLLCVCMLAAVARTWHYILLSFVQHDMCIIIPSTCIRERDIVIAPLVRVCVCVSVCLHLIAS